MVVGWVNYAGITLCVHCAEREWGPDILAGAQPVWINTYGATVACAQCKRLVNQAHREAEEQTRKRWYA